MRQSAHMKVETKTLRVSGKLHSLVKQRAAKCGMKLESFTEHILASALRESKRESK